MSDRKTNPVSRREVWLDIALGIARDGLPEPRDVSMYPTACGIPFLAPFVTLTFDTHAASDAWARWLGVAQHEDKLFEHYKPTPRIRRRYSSHDRGGWSWEIEGYESVAEAGSSPLAEQVVAAILTPDAVSLPAELVAA